MVARDLPLPVPGRPASRRPRPTEARRPHGVRRRARRRALGVRGMARRQLRRGRDRQSAAQLPARADRRHLDRRRPLPRRQPRVPARPLPGRDRGLRAGGPDGDPQGRRGVGREAPDGGDRLLDPRRDERPHPGRAAGLLPDGADGLFFRRAGARARGLPHARGRARLSGDLVLPARPLHRRLLAALHVRDLRRLDLLRARRRERRRPAAEGPADGAAVPRSGLSLRSLLFVLAAALLVANTLVTSPRESSLGLAFIALGIPIYYAQKAFRKCRAKDARVKVLDALGRRYFPRWPAS